MEFIVNKETKTVSIAKEFNAELSLVWDAYTKRELLDQWWAPKPFTSVTKVMDFEVGGRRFYAMVGPDGTERWAVQKYTSITPKTNFKFFNAFADADENLQLPGSDWSFDFIALGDTTTVSVSIYNESLERMERIMADGGFQNGTEMQLQNLEELLAKLSRQNAH
ncbi:MAG: SRPBCC domain-containing protein [Acidobacteria bacterium]|nr:SRPBCC domain-containing protein [Acidobacteriota bacterium]MCW5949146.1 SRPBCC domain-containing protein [Pyrinomonadaceae bacterium]